MYNTGRLITLEQQADYVADPLALYQHLCRQRPNSLLLESAEVDSKADLKSLMLVDAALRIECCGRQVSYQALSANGSRLLPFLARQFCPDTTTQQTPDTLTLHFPEPEAGLDEDSRLKAVSPLEALRVLQRRLHPDSLDANALFVGGVFAYDLIASVEQLPQVDAGTNHCPDYVFYLAETLILIDHQHAQTRLLGSLFADAPGSEEQQRLSSRLTELAGLCTAVPASSDATPATIGTPLDVDISDQAFCHHVDTLKHYIRQGDIFQVVPSRSFNLPCPDPIAAYRKLKETNPSPYMFYLQDEHFVLFGASPESALKYNHGNNQVEVYPIAGTRPRGFDSQGGIDLDLDGRLELELRLDKKEMAEHLMLVDLARNDIARIAIPGSRHVADLLKVDRYSHVMHLVSRVVGQLRPDLDALHAYQACMNMGTLVGAPKIRAAELVRQVEQQRRGSYGGAVGYLNGRGDMDTCIVIRSAFVDDGIAHVQAGAGVVFDSIPQAEADETRNKAAAVLNAIALAHGTTLAEVSHG